MLHEVIVARIGSSKHLSNRMLKPGGFLEVQELLLVPRSRCGAERLANHLVGECFSTLSVAFAALGINLSAPTDIVDLMTNAGFEDIVMKEIAVPCGPWAVGNDHRQLGTWMLFWLREALPGLINKPLGLGLGLTQMEVEIFWAKLNRELRLEVMRELLLEFTFIVVYGCKPLE